MNSCARRQLRVSEPEALPPDLRDLPRFRHPSKEQNRRVGGCGRLPLWSGPGVSAQVASLQSLTLCSGQHQCREQKIGQQVCNCRRR
jgi:hypothetical protein